MDITHEIVQEQPIPDELLAKYNKSFIKASWGAKNVVIWHRKDAITGMMVVEHMSLEDFRGKHMKDIGDGLLCAFMHLYGRPLVQLVVILGVYALHCIMDQLHDSKTTTRGG